MTFPEWFAKSFPNHPIEGDLWYFTLEAWYSAMEHEARTLAEAIYYVLALDLDFPKGDRKALINILNLYRKNHPSIVLKDELPPFAYKVTTHEPPVETRQV